MFICRRRAAAVVDEEEEDDNDDDDDDDDEVDEDEDRECLRWLSLVRFARSRLALVYVTWPLVTVAVYFTAPLLDGRRKSCLVAFFVAVCVAVAPWVERVTPLSLDTCSRRSSLLCVIPPLVAELLAAPVAPPPPPALASLLCSALSARSRSRLPE